MCLLSLVGAQDNELSAHLCSEAKHDTYVSWRGGGKLAASLTILCHVPEMRRGNDSMWEFHIPS